MSYVNYGRAAHESGLRTSFETSAPKDTWAEDWTKPVTDAGSKPRHSLEDSKCTAAGLSPYMDMQMFMARQASDGEKMLQRLAPGSMDARPQISTNSISSPSNLVGQPTVQAPTPVQAQADKPPPGCAADAIKLFVGNIPKSCTESQLLPFFETIGKVVDLVILRDKITHASKGSAFLWYATRMQAEMAILQFNLRHTLPDPTGEHVRPVVLRKAKCTTKNPVQGAASDVGQARPAESISSLLSQTYSSRSMMPQGFSSGPQAVGQMTVPRCGSQQVELDVMDSLAQAWGRLQMGTQTQGRRDGYDSYPQDLMGTYLGKGSGQYMEPQPEPEVMTVAIALNRQQLSAVNDCMHDVQVISGAQLSINPRGTTGLFQLCITGIQRQVKAAQNLVETIFR